LIDFFVVAGLGIGIIFYFSNKKITGEF